MASPAISAAKHTRPIRPGRRARCKPPRSYCENGSAYRKASGNMTDHGFGIIGLGYQLPANIRLNDDRIFDAVRKNKSQKDILALFQGFERRHVLGPDETLVDIMASAAEKAMIDAGVTPADIDLLI